jgi:imidazolonepropionase-like amidohydrolase
VDNPHDLIAIVGATLIDGNGGAPINDSVILIEGKRIAAIADRTLQIPNQAQQIAAHGKFVIPGLIDAHVWSLDGTIPTVLIRHEGRYEELVIEAAQLTLKNGVTTLFDGWGPRDVLIKARNAIQSGRVIGSRIYCSGNWIGLGGPFSSDLRQQYRTAVYGSFATRIDALWESGVGPRLIAMSPQQVRQEIRTYLRSGVDYLSYAASDHHIGALRFIVFSPRVQHIIVDEAHRAGLPACGFRPATGEAIYLALEAGVDVLQFPDYTAYQPLPEETIALMAQRQIPCLIEAMTNETVEHVRKVAPPEFLLDILVSNNQALVRAGVPLLLGTAGFVIGADNTELRAVFTLGKTTKILGDGHFVWFEAMQDMGMKPMTMLMAATRDVAQAYKVDKDLGTLERGKLADLLILERSPLEKAENYRSLSLVMKEGRVIDRDALPITRLLTA